MHELNLSILVEVQIRLKLLNFHERSSSFTIGSDSKEFRGGTPPGWSWSWQKIGRRASQLKNTLGKLNIFQKFWKNTCNSDFTSENPSKFKNLGRYGGVKIGLYKLHKNRRSVGDVREGLMWHMWAMSEPMNFAANCIHFDIKIFRGERRKCRKIKGVPRKNLKMVRKKCFFLLQRNQN